MSNRLNLGAKPFSKITKFLSESNNFLMKISLRLILRLFINDVNLFYEQSLQNVPWCECVANIRSLLDRRPCVKIEALEKFLDK